MKEVPMLCPNCSQEVSETDQVCEHCGHELTTVPSQKSAATRRQFPTWIVLILVAAVAGVLAGAVFSRLKNPSDAAAGASPTDTAIRDSVRAEQVVGTTASDSLADEVRPPGGYAIPANYGDIGPELVDVGAIDLDRFVELYEQAGQPLTEAQLEILKEGADAPVVITLDNSYFLLNFFWAMGLANRNPLLEVGPMMQYGEENVGRFASTGGWTLGREPATEFYSSARIVSLTAEQQARLEDVANAVYRPCCGNSTAFPDCNHGIAMLGLLELMASQGATEDEMFEAAKYVNAFWFPQQMLEVATFFEATEGVSFADLEGRIATGPDYFSGAGFGDVHQYLADNGLLELLPSQGGSCGV